MSSNIASEASDLDFITRFVCIGSEDGCHSILQKQDYRSMTPSLHLSLTRDSALEVIRRLQIILERRILVNKDPLLYALATIIRNVPPTDGHGDDAVRHGAYNLAVSACESPMDLFTFVSFDKAVSGPSKAGWGRGMKRVVRQWYESKSPLVLATEVTKCKSGRGWTHRDLIRQSHIRPDKKSKGTSVVLNYLAQGKKVLEEFKNCDEEEEDVQKVVLFLKDIELLIASTVEEKQIVHSLIEKNKFIERQIPSHFFHLKETFEALLGHMDLVNVIKSIPKMAALGMLDHDSPEAFKVIALVRNFEAIKQQKVLPINIFVALRKYESNKSKKWIKNHSIVAALHAAFNASLQCLPKTGKQTLLAIHIDSKISKRRVSGANFLTPLMPCALMAKFLLHSENRCQVVYFHQRVVELKLAPSVPVTGIVENIVRSSKEPTNANYDLSEPLKWATQNKKSFDNILIMSDKKVVSSPEAFHNALKTYRTELSLPLSKLAVIGLSDLTTTVGNKFDLNMLEVSGFNENIPPLIYNFFGGKMEFSKDSCAQSGTPIAP